MDAKCWSWERHPTKIGERQRGEWKDKKHKPTTIQFQIRRVSCICNCLRVDLAFRDAKRMDWVLIVLKHTNTHITDYTQTDTLAIFFPRVCA